MQLRRVEEMKEAIAAPESSSAVQTRQNELKEKHRQDIQELYDYEAEQYLADAMDRYLSKDDMAPDPVIDVRPLLPIVTTSLLTPITTNYPPCRAYTPPSATQRTPSKPALLPPGKPTATPTSPPSSRSKPYTRNSPPPSSHSSASKTRVSPTVCISTGRSGTRRRSCASRVSWRLTRW